MKRNLGRTNELDLYFSMVMNDPAIRIIFFIVRIRIVGEGQEDITHQIVFF